MTPDTLLCALFNRAAAIAGAIIGPHTYFDQTGGQVITGPTLTSVNDFRAIVILPLTLQMDTL
ncbi:hypothetical protein [Yoonia sp. MH D7]